MIGVLYAFTILTELRRLASLEIKRVISDKTMPSPSAKLQTTLLKLGQRILWSSGIVREYGETENTWHARARPRRLDGNQMFCLLGAHPTDTPISTLGYDIPQLPRFFPDFSMLSIVLIIVSAAHSGWAVRHPCQSLARQSLRWEYARDHHSRHRTPNQRNDPGALLPTRATTVITRRHWITSSGSIYPDRGAA